MNCTTGECAAIQARCTAGIIPFVCAVAAGFRWRGSALLGRMPLGSLVVMYRAAFRLFLALSCAGLMNAQPPAADLAGDWVGTLGSGAEKLRLKLHVIKTYDGLYIGKLLSIDQGDGAIPVGRVVVEGRSIALEFPVVSGS